MHSQKTQLEVVDDRTTDGIAADRIEQIATVISREGLDLIVYKSISRRAEAFLQHGHRTIYAHDLKKRMEKKEPLFLLDIRLSENYAAGHIPGSLNVEFIDITEQQNLAMLPRDGTPIIVICYTGHTASQLASVLNLLGYNAWTLRFGMMSWNALTRISVWSSKDAQEVSGGGFSIATVEKTLTIGR